MNVQIVIASYPTTLRYISAPMNVPIVLNVPNKQGLYARIVVAIVSNGPNEAKASRSSRVEPQHV